MTNMTSARLRWMMEELANLPEPIVAAHPDVAAMLRAAWPADGPRIEIVDCSALPRTERTESGEEEFAAYVVNMPLFPAAVAPEASRELFSK